MQKLTSAGEGTNISKLSLQEEKNMLLKRIKDDNSRIKKIEDLLEITE